MIILVGVITPILEWHETFDVSLSDSVQDLLAESVDLAIRISPDYSPDAVVKRVASTSLVCVGSRSYFERHGTPVVPEDLQRHNCIVYNGMDHWTFDAPEGSLKVRVSGNLSSDTVETVLAAVRDGIGVGMFYRASLVGDMDSQDIVTVLEDYISETRDVSLVWPHRRFISARVRKVTDFFEAELARRM